MPLAPYPACLFLSERVRAKYITQTIPELPMCWGGVWELEPRVYSLGYLFTYLIASVYFLYARQSSKPKILRVNKTAQISTLIEYPDWWVHIDDRCNHVRWREASRETGGGKRGRDFCGVGLQFESYGHGLCPRVLWVRTWAVSLPVLWGTGLPTKRQHVPLTSPVSK